MRALRFFSVRLFAIAITLPLVSLGAATQSWADDKADDKPAAAPAMLSPAEAAKGGAFIQTLGSSVLKTLSSKDVNQKAAEATFRQLLTDSFDIPTISRFAIGQYWRKLTPPQRDEYTKLFNELCVRIYTDRFALYTGENFKVTDSRAEDDRDAVVSSFIDKPNGEKIKTDWRVRRQADGAFRIVDVIVEGVSMVLTHRSEFTAVLQRNNGEPNALFDTIREKIGAAPMPQAAATPAATPAAAPGQAPAKETPAKEGPAKASPAKASPAAKEPDSKKS